MMLFFAANDPNVNFISIGTKFENELANTKSIIFTAEEVGFLAGYLTAGLTRVVKLLHLLMTRVKAVII